MRPADLRVLTYHRVLPAAMADGNPTASATPQGFERQMRHLSRHYRVVSADDVREARAAGRPLPPRAVLITFDDAYRDFGEIAWPILRTYGFRATLFVPSAYPGEPWRRFWWDRLLGAFGATAELEVYDPAFGRLSLGTPAARRAALRDVRGRVKRLPHEDAMAAIDRLLSRLGEPWQPGPAVHTWTELRQLASEGVTLGAHTRTHPALTRLPVADARAEIEGSRDDLMRQLGATPRVFAYPFGDHDDAVVRLVRDAGFDLAVTCSDGHNHASADALRLRRTNITCRTTPMVFWFRLTAAGAGVDRWRHRRPASPGQRPPTVATADRPLRVAYIMSRFPKLSETFVLNEMETVAALGVPVDIYPLIRERVETAHPEVASWMSRAHFHGYVSPAVLRAHLSCLRRRPRTYAALGAEVLRRTWGSRKLFVGALGTFPKAVRFAHEMQQDGVTHVHAHFATHPALAALIVHRLTGLPFSFTAHGSDIHVDRRMLDCKVEAAAFAVAISRFNKEVMAGACAKPLRHKIHVVHCGVDPRCFAPRTGPRPPGPVRFVCVASFEPVKGHVYLIDACRVLHARGVEFRCDLVGEGPLKGAIVRRIAESGLSDRVHVLGGLPRPDVVRLLAAGDVAVLASHPTADGRREGIPVALMEAMASGLPVVSSAISGIPELVESGVSGLLVRSGDAALLADALERLAGDVALRERMGREGRRRVLADFDLESNTRRLLNLFSPGVVPVRQASPETAAAVVA